MVIPSTGIVRKKVVKVEKPVEKESRKRKHIWQTWVERSHVIFMLLHPEIFNGNAAEASELLGIPRSTLLGYISTNPKRNMVPKWFDLVSRLS